MKALASLAVLSVILGGCQTLQSSSPSEPLFVRKDGRRETAFVVRSIYRDARQYVSTTNGPIREVLHFAPDAAALVGVSDPSDPSPQFDFQILRRAASLVAVSDHARTGRKRLYCVISIDPPVLGYVDGVLYLTEMDAKAGLSQTSPSLWRWPLLSEAALANVRLDGVVDLSPRVWRAAKSADRGATTFGDYVVAEHRFDAPVPAGAVVEEAAP